LPSVARGQHDRVGVVLSGLIEIGGHFVYARLRVGVRKLAVNIVYRNEIEGNGNRFVTAVALSVVVIVLMRTVLCTRRRTI
jgi:hypothetical protein